MIVKLSRSQWNAIGIVAGWQKKATFKMGPRTLDDGFEIMLNGTSYLIIGHSTSPSGISTVELAGDTGDLTLKFDQMGFSADKVTEEASGIRARKERTFDDLGVTIREGEEGHNLKGRYKVTSMSDNLENMTVEYIDGPNAGSGQLLNVRNQAQHMHNEIIREYRRMGFQELHLTGADESFTLGYLASKAWLACLVTPDNYQNFKETYQRLTGEQLDTHLGTNFWIRKGEGGWDWYKIHFPPPDPVTLNSMKLKEDGIIPIASPNTWGGMQFNNKHFFLNLLANGFKLGKKQDIQSIRSRASDPENFDKGVNYIPQEQAIQEVASVQSVFHKSSYKLSKSQWQRIGEKAKWCKTAEWGPKPIDLTRTMEEDAGISRQRIVKVTFDDGDVVSTGINGTKQEIWDYYTKNDTTFAKSDESGTHRGVNVEFLK